MLPARLLALASLCAATHLDLDDNSLTVGGAHACALERVDELSVGGEVVCWGDARGGALDSPRGLFVQLSAAGAATCGVSADQKVACWGGGARARAIAEGAAAAPGGAAAAQVSLGARHACALRAGDAGGGGGGGGGGARLACWGDDAAGAVSRAPARGGVAQVSCGGDACCALVGADAGGGGALELACWGAGDGGVVADAPRGAFLQVSVAADAHACAVGADFRLWCWGSFISPAGGARAWNGTFVQVAAAEGVSCALRADGTLLCLGEERRLWSGRRERGAAAGDERPPPPRDAQFSEISAQ